MTSTLYTIGFTQSTAEHFFGRLRDAGIRVLLDIRRHNTSQLAGFAKATDLAYFLDRLLGARYQHRLDLAPTADLVKAYRSGRIDWDAFAGAFQDQLRAQAVEQGDRAAFEGPTVLLCSEATADRCHRRLVAEHLARHWTDLDITHL